MQENELPDQTDVDKPGRHGLGDGANHPGGLGAGPGATGGAVSAPALPVQPQRHRLLPHHHWDAGGQIRVALLPLPVQLLLSPGEVARYPGGDLAGGDRSDADQLLRRIRRVRGQEHLHLRQLGHGGQEWTGHCNRHLLRVDDSKQFTLSVHVHQNLQNVATDYNFSISTAKSEVSLQDSGQTLGHHGKFHVPLPPPDRAECRRSVHHRCPVNAKDISDHAELRRVSHSV